MPSQIGSRSFRRKSFISRRQRAALVGLALVALPAWPIYSALAAQPPVGLGTAGSFAVLAGAGVTNTGPSVLNGDLGLSPTPTYPGFPPGTVNGSVYAGDAVAGQAETDLTTAYDDAAGRTPPNTVSGDLGGRTLTPGVYKSGSSLGLTGTLTLDAQGDPNAVFVFQAGSTLTTASASDISLIGGAQACNVYWQVGSSATLGTTSVFTGNILAYNSITVNTGVTVYGRALARTGAVTLDDDTITPEPCASQTSTGTTPSGSTPTGSSPTTSTPSGSTGTGTKSGGTGTKSGGTYASGGTTTSGEPIGKGEHGDVVLTTDPRSVVAMIARDGTSKCVHGTFAVSVAGRSISKVTFSLGHEAINSTRGPRFRATVAAVGGVHVVTARVTFDDGKQLTGLRLRFRACAAKAIGLPHPIVPIVSSGFTG